MWVQCKGFAGSHAQGRLSKAASAMSRFHWFEAVVSNLADCVLYSSLHCSILFPSQANLYVWTPCVMFVFPSHGGRAAL